MLIRSTVSRLDPYFRWHRVKYENVISELNNIRGYGTECGLYMSIADISPDDYVVNGDKVCKTNACGLVN